MLSYDLEFISAFEPADWTAHDRTHIVESLDSGEVEDRRLAASLVWRIGGHEPKLLSLFTSDPDPEVRAAAAIALGPLLEAAQAEAEVDHDLVERVREAFRRTVADLAEPTIVRRRALESAARFPDAWMVAVAQDACLSEEPEWRATGVRAASYTGDLDDLIEDAFGDEALLVRIEAVEATMRRTIKGAIFLVRSWAQTAGTDRDLRIAAINALPHFPDESVREVLELLAVDEDDDIAWIAGDAQEKFEQFNPQDFGDLER